MYLMTAAEMAELDRRTIEEVGLPGAVLMENAGRGAARAILERFGREPRTVAIVCGRGNNGGDGFVVARLLAARGFGVNVALVGARDRVGGDAAVHLRAFEGAGGRVAVASEAEAFRAWADLVPAPELIVDAIFGTGLGSEVTGVASLAIEWMDRSPAPVVAIDVPSGVDASSGRVWGSAPHCTLTVTFGYPKLGHVLPPGSDLAGDVRVVDIGIPGRLLEGHEPPFRWLESDEMRRLLVERPPQAHKGTFGHLLVVGGSAGKSGAAGLAARAALRAGVGLVTVAGPAALGSALESLVLETMSVALPDRGTGELGTDALPALTVLAAGKQAVAIGPGLGRSTDAETLVRALVSTLPNPMVIDADALVALAGDPRALRQSPGSRVLTPHPGEMARLASCTKDEVQADRLGVATRFAVEHRVHLVLKGAGTVIAHPDGRASINSTGNPGMASGGMGDVLTGVVGALLASGMEAGTAAELAVHLHGAAGDRVASLLGGPGLLASEVADQLPRARADLSAGHAPAREPRLRRVEAP